MNTIRWYGTIVWHENGPFNSARFCGTVGHLYDRLFELKVLKTTGFFENLFDDEELTSENVKDRDSKISFLTKVIYVISTTTGKSLSVKPSKIVAGQEPGKTNELLQCLAQALDSKLSSATAVKQYKESLKSTQTSETENKEASKPLRKNTDSKKATSRSTEKLTNQKATRVDKEKSNDVKNKRKENGSNKIEAQNKKSQLSKAIAKKNQKDDNAQRRAKPLTPSLLEKQNNSITEKSDITTLNKLRSQDSDISLERDISDNIANVVTLDSPIRKSDDHAQFNTSYTINENDLNSSASTIDNLEIEQKSFENNHANVVENKLIAINNTTETSLTNIHQRSIDNNEILKLKHSDIVAQDSDNLKRKSVENNKESENNIIDIEKHDSFNVGKISDLSTNDTKSLPLPNVKPLNVRPSSSRPGAPRMREKDNVIKDTDNLLMGKVNIIVENTQHDEEDDSSLTVVHPIETVSTSQKQHDLQLTSSEHGHLVQQILDSQKEFSQNSGKTEIEWQLGALKARETVNQDIEQLRYSIQALSRIANPLGKLLDHIQEDVEVMRQELQQWSNIYDDVNKDMLKQKTLSEDSLSPFHTKLKQLEGEIEEKHDKINDLKILIHKNANRIEKLLSSGNVQ